jgi:hypothetical protein
MTFNVLIATLGRHTLQRMLDSLKNQLQEQDCLTLVFDGHSTIPLFNLDNFKCEIKQYCEPVALGAWGHGIRNKYASLLEKRDFVMHGDDDDFYLPAFDELRSKCVNKDTLYIARMNHTKMNDILPQGPFIRINHIGTPNGIIPYELNKSSVWKHQYGGDGIFYEELATKASVEFLSTIIYQV